MSEPATRDRFRGCLLGLAVCDALGTTLEFKPPGTFTPIDDMIGGGPYDLQPGQWTDDTSMALCLAASLLECNGFDPKAQMQRYVHWMEDGYMSSIGWCFDIGITVGESLRKFQSNGDPYAGSTATNRAGNGSLMRLAPVPMYFAGDAAKAIEHCALSSRTTHATPDAVDACRYYGGLLVSALSGVSKQTLLTPGYCPVEGAWERNSLTPNIAEIAGGSFSRREPPEIKGTGHVVKSLEAALWAFNKSDDFREGALLAVNLGDDADTTGAIYGQLAGAHYGAEAIPASWRAQLTMVDQITAFADSLYEASLIGA